MKHLFLPYSLALKAKEKRFNEPCFGVYTTHVFKDVYELDLEQYMNFEFEDTMNDKFSLDSKCCSAPLYQQIVDWLREKHNLHINLAVNQFGYGFMYSIIDIKASKCVKFLTGGANHKFSYYEALSFAIEQALNLIK